MTQGTPITTPAEGIGAWIKDPVLFVQHVFKDEPPVEPDGWQKDVLRAFPTHQRIGMKSCKGPGKTTLLAWLIWHFMATRPNPKVAVTSITSDNLTDNLWSELAKWYGKSEFLQSTFDLGKTRITSKENPLEWYCSAKTWSKDADATQQSLTLAGFHSDYVLFVLDEVGGIPNSVMASAEAALSTGKEMKIVMAGNPTHLEGPLWNASNEEKELWHMTEITGDPDDPKRSPRVSIQWAREQIAKYGRENPWVMVNVFGKFPPASMNSLLGPDDVSAAMKRHMPDDRYSFSQKRLGVDVARFGDDSTIIFPRQGLAAFHPVEMKNARTHEIAARIAHARKEWGSEMEIIDSTGGFGAGVEDALLQAGVDAIPVHFSGRANDPRYFNKRSEMWFLMAEWVKKGGALPPIDRLAKELTTPTYSFHNGKLRLEEKDQIRQRLNFSPDYADALCFVAGTLVTTPHGCIHIEDLRVGDMVSTPVGPRKILRVWESETKKLARAKFSNGAELCGRPEHEIFTWNRGWVRLDSLVWSDTMEADSIWSKSAWAEVQKLYTKASAIGLKRALTSGQAHPTKAKGLSIASYGRSSLAPFLAALTSTTRTAIEAIMPSRIWNACLQASTHDVTWLRKSGLQPSERECPHGRVGGGEAGSLLMQPALAFSVARNTRHTLLHALLVAHPPVGGNSTIAGRGQRDSSARSAGKLLSAIRGRPKSKSIAPVSVHEDHVPTTKVFNLSVDRDNVYYANGILVANCLTFAIPDMPAEDSPMMLGVKAKRGREQYDYDPLEDPQT